jgi:hypothetical protein
MLKNPLSPNAMTAAERLDEVARFLVLAILRRRGRRENISESSPTGLDSGRKNEAQCAPERRAAR